MKRIWVCVCSILLVLPAGARLIPQVCGTNRETAREELHRHRVSTSRRMAQPRREQPRAVRAIGNIALMEDSDGVVALPNPFDLDKSSLAFSLLPGGGYQYKLSTGGYDASDAERGEAVALGDDDARLIALPFEFTFYGKARKDVWVHSDGNLTFGEPDAESSARSLGRMTAGPARIAPLFADLDPSRAGSVRVLSSGSRFVVSYTGVPEYTDFGTGPTQNFQVRLYPDGSIEFAWDAVSLSSAVVGLAPGSLQGSTSLVRFREDPSSSYSGAVAERFGTTSAIDMVRTAQRFYESFDDAYDYLVVFNRMGIAAQSGAVAYESTVRGTVRGIGEEIFDRGAIYGSASRLRAVINMGPVGQYNSDPYVPIADRGSVTGDNTMTVIAHEAGHLFLALVSVQDEEDSVRNPMLGGQDAHWSFNFNSEASLLEGNRIRDNGAGARPRFLTTGTVEGYSPLDQYLMGFRAPEEVPDSFWVKNSNRPKTRLPQVGVEILGSRRDVTISEIRSVAGPRLPDHTVSQRRFRFAFIVVTAAGTEPAETELSAYDGWRKEFELYFNRAAGGRAWADTRLNRASRISLAPAAGVVAGRSITATLEVSAPVTEDLTYRLDGAAPLLQVPATVTMAKGQRQTSFEVRGAAPGVADLMAAPGSDLYETAHARVQVQADLSQVRLEAIKGANAVLIPAQANAVEVAVRVVDGNLLPYAGLAVQADGDGSVQPAAVITGADGVARFQWLTSTGPARLLTVRLQDRPATAVEIAVLGPPMLSSAGIVNAASYAPGLTPGGFATLFGFNLWSGQALGPLPQWPSSLDSVRVLANGVPAEMLITSLRQINIRVPESTAPGTAQVVVENLFGASETVTVPVLAVQPGLFFDAGTGLAAARQVGRFFELYGTGFGGAVAVSAEVDGLPARIHYSGPTAGIPGLHQVNIELPDSVGPGEHTVVVQAGGVRSNTAKLMVR